MNEYLIPEINVTMVAFHQREKPKPLKKLVGEVVETINSNLRSTSGTALDEYSISQIHATIVGMEADMQFGRLFSRWFRKNNNGELRTIDAKRFQEIVKTFIQDGELFTIRFGGFRPAHCTCDPDASAVDSWRCRSSDAEFHSCDRSPYEGSFYGFSPGPAILTGWPVRSARDGETFTHRLYEFRRAVEEAGFLDKHHGMIKSHWKNDDFFLRLGTLPSNIPNESLRLMKNAVRKCLSERESVTIDVTVDDVTIVLYDDTSLAETHVKASVPLASFLDDHARIEGLYRCASA